MDWRLQVELRDRLHLARVDALRHRKGALEQLVETERIGPDVTIMHEGRTVVATGTTATGLDSADARLRRALVADGRTASIRATRWDPATGAWSEVNPALTPLLEPAAPPVAARPDAVTRIAECSIGRFSRASAEAAIAEAARRHGLVCQITATPAPLRTRLTVTVSGPEHRVWLFTRELRGLTGSDVGP